MKLVQIEFYGILSPKVKSMQANESQESGKYPPLNEVQMSMWTFS